jgi:hypothetical protein
MPLDGPSTAESGKYNAPGGGLPVARSGGDRWSALARRCEYGEPRILAADPTQ